jgi:hypothetical protein
MCVGSGLPSTPWMLSGDLRTLFPYVFFRPVDVRSRYVRRWVRVHLADRDAEREQALKKANGMYVCMYVCIYYVIRLAPAIHNCPTTTQLPILKEVAFIAAVVEYCMNVYTVCMCLQTICCYCCCCTVK